MTIVCSTGLSEVTMSQIKGNKNQPIAQSAGHRPRRRDVTVLGCIL